MTNMLTYQINFSSRTFPGFRSIEYYKRKIKSEDLQLKLSFMLYYCCIMFYVIVLCNVLLCSAWLYYYIVLCFVILCFMLYRYITLCLLLFIMFYGILLYKFMHNVIVLCCVLLHDNIKSNLVIIDGLHRLLCLS
jgi:uncharacterized membrane protein